MSNVNHPNHYQSESGLEVIDVIKAFTADLSGEEAFCIGNAIKYLCRYNKKNGVEDLSKAEWYIERAISIRKKQFPKLPNPNADVQNMNKNKRTYKLPENEYARLRCNCPCKLTKNEIKRLLNAIYGAKNFRMDAYNTSPNKTNDFSPFEFECVRCSSREEAGKILKDMRSIISDYGHATLADLHDLCSIDVPSSVYNQVGWTTVNHFHIIPRGYYGWEIIPSEFDYVENAKNDRVNKLVEQAKRIANSTAWAIFPSRGCLEDFEAVANATLEARGYINAGQLGGLIASFRGDCALPERIESDDMVMLYNPSDPDIGFDEPYCYPDNTWGVLIPLVNYKR